MTKRARRSEIISRVSKVADVRPDVVRDVLNALTSVTIEEVVNNGSFQMSNVFRISNSPWAGYTAGGGRVIPPHNRLSVKLSESVRTLYKLKQDDPDLEITSENWREVLRDAVSPKNNPLEEEDSDEEDGSPTTSSSKKPASESDAFNPFLDEDYD